MSLWLIILLVVGVFVAHGAVVLNTADLMTRSPRRRVEGAPADFGLRYEAVEFPSDHGILLRGWYLESPGARATVVLVHDLRSTRSSHGALGLQREYVRRGFHVLAFDLRGHGESTGGRGGLGDLERHDVAAAITFAQHRAADLPIVLHGFGLGAALALDAAAMGQPVTGVIADSPFADARVQLHRRWHHRSRYLFGSALRLATRFTRAKPSALRVGETAAALGVPTLLIHQRDDAVTPASDAVNIAAATTADLVELWTPAGDAHCGAYLAQPESYTRHCLALIDRAVPMRLATEFAGEAAARSAPLRPVPAVSTIAG